MKLNHCGRKIFGDRFSCLQGKNSILIDVDLLWNIHFTPELSLEEAELFANEILNSIKEVRKENKQ